MVSARGRVRRVNIRAIVSARGSVRSRAIAVRVNTRAMVSDRGRVRSRAIAVGAIESLVRVRARVGAMLSLQNLFSITKAT